MSGDLLSASSKSKKSRVVLCVRVLESSWIFCVRFLLYLFVVYQLCRNLSSIIFLPRQYSSRAATVWSEHTSLVSQEHHPLAVSSYPQDTMTVCRSWSYNFMQTLLYVSAAHSPRPLNSFNFRIAFAFEESQKAPGKLKGGASGFPRTTPSKPGFAA